MSQIHSRNIQAKGVRTALAGINQEPNHTVSSIDLERVCAKVDPDFAGRLPSPALTGLTQLGQFQYSNIV